MMDALRLVCVFLVGVMGLLRQPCAGITVTVDPQLGNDAACLSIQDLASNSSLSETSIPCRTLNRALGADGVSCDSISCAQGDLDGFDDALILLEDGDHRLTCKTFVMINL